MPCGKDCPDLTGYRSRAHCAVCHNTFTGVWAFDQHRVGGQCKLPGKLINRNGIWGNPGERPPEVFQ